MLEQLMKNDLQQWITEVLLRHRLNRPDGRMLFQYRLQAVEYDELKAALHAACNIHPLSTIAENNLSFPAAFVMFGAEWWKREYAGRVWSWQHIIQTFGADPESWSPPQRTATVLSGLRFWGHSIHRNGIAYLGSVITQGGIPQVLLSEGHGAITGVLVSAGRRASRLHAKDNEVISIVRDHQDRLPHSLQRTEIIELIAKTIDAVMELQDEFSLNGSAEECIERLDSIAPDWKEKFPLPLEIAATATLIRRLIGEVIESRGDDKTPQFTVDRYLRLSDGQYQLTSKLIQPATISAEQFAKLLGVPEASLPRHMTIDIETSRRELISDARRLLGASPIAFSLSPPRRYWTNQEAAAEHLLHVHLAGFVAPALALPGGAELDTQVPWVFSDEDGALRLVGVGSQRVRSKSAWICYPNDWKVENREGTSIDEVGSLTLGDKVRLIAHVNGECWIRGSDDTQYRIRTGQEGVEANQYVWIGQRLGFPSNPRQVFIGLPKLYCHSPDGDRQIPKSEIQWRRAGSKQPFGSEFQVSGPVDAIFKIDGEVVFRTRMVVLDRTAKLTFQSGLDASAGVIEFLGEWGHHALSMETSAATANVRELPTSWLVTLGAPVTKPETITFLLDWDHSLVPLRLSLPFPVSGGRFFDGEGEEIQTSHSLAPRDLIGARLRILDSNPNRPMKYSLQLNALVGRQQVARSQMYPIQLTGNFAEVRLFDFKLAIESLLSSSDALDANVELVLWVGNQPREKISVKRYDCLLETESNGVALSQSDLQRLLADSIKGIKVLGTRLHDFSHAAVEFIPMESEGVPSGRWFPRTFAADSKPLFVYPSPDSCLQFRPMIIPGHASESEIHSETEGLASAIVIPNHDARGAAMNRALTIMAADHRHQDWRLVESMRHKLEHLPLSSLDFWRRLVVHPDALVAFTLRPWEDASSESISLYRRFTDELGLIWETIPLTAWRNGFRALRRYWLSTLSGEAAKQVMMLDINSKVSALKEFCPDLTFVLDLMAWEITSQKSAEHNRMRNVRKELGENTLCRHAYSSLWHGQESHLQQVLLHQHLDADWPSGLSDQVIKELVVQAKFKALLESHAPKMFWMEEDHKSSVANIPVLLAFSLATESLTEMWLKPQFRAALKQHHDFDPEWFRIAFEHGIQMCYALDLFTLQPSPN